MNIELLPKLRQVDPDTFEYFVAYLWEQFGWTAGVTQSSRDGGIDVVAVQHLPTKQTHGIQVKRYAQGTNVSATTVREVAGQLNDGFDSVAIVTTSDFTTPAKEDASRLGVRIINGRDIQKMVEGADISVDDLRQFISVGEDSSSSERSKVDDNESIDSQSNKGGNQNGIDIAYDADLSNIEHRTTNKEKLTSSQNINILNKHLGKQNNAQSEKEYEIQHQYLNYYSMVNDSIGKIFQIAGHCYNIASLTEGDYRTAENFFQQKKFDIISQRTPNPSKEQTGWITVSDPRGKRVTPQRIASITKKSLKTVHDVGLEDIVAIEARGERQESSEVWEWVEK